MIRDHACHHRFADGDSPDADAWVVTALGHDFGLVAVAIDRAARREDRRGGLDRKAHHHRLAGGNSAKDSAGVVGQKSWLVVITHAHVVGVLLARERGRTKACADLDALDRVDAHHRRSKIAIELAIDRRAEARRHAVGHDLDHRAD
jgi:hypothetical protein